MDDPARGRALSDDGRAGLVPAGLDATLVLLRHGESTFIAEGRFQGQQETPLSAIGRRQAGLAAARLAAPHASPALPVPATRPLEVVHSPLRRTTETAEAVSAALAGAARDLGAAAGSGSAAVEGLVGPPRRPEPGILEIGQGEWEGLPAATITERWGDVLATWRTRPLEAWAPGGEDLPSVQARVRPALERLLGTLAAAAPPEPPVREHVLGYGDPASDQPWSIVVGHDGIFKVLLLTLFDIPLERFWTFSFALCGISVVEFRNGRATLRAHNLTEHLAPMLDERAQAVSEARERTGAL